MCVCVRVFVCGCVRVCVAERKSKNVLKCVAVCRSVLQVDRCVCVLGGGGGVGERVCAKKKI